MKTKESKTFDGFILLLHKHLLSTYEMYAL